MPSQYTKLIVDLDGTLYRGPQALPGAVEAITQLRATHRILFLSNNCNMTSETLAQRLRGLGFEADPQEVVSSVTLMVEAVDQLGRGLRVLTLCSGDLDRALQEAGHQTVKAGKPDVVVVAVDFDVSYSKIRNVLSALRAGAVFIGANADATYPTENGPQPAAGAFVGAVRGMGFTPSHMCGKPDPWAMQTALRLRGFTVDKECLLIGDRLDSDILGAEALGIDSALVLTGASTRSDIERLRIHPTYLLEAFPAITALVHHDCAPFDPTTDGGD